MSKDRYQIDIVEAEKGYAVYWKRIGYPDEEILLCPDKSKVIEEVSKILDVWKTINREVKQ